MTSNKPDKFLKTMQHLIKTWKKVPQDINIFDSKLTTTPHYISISYKENDTFEVSMVNGALVSQPQIIQDTGFSSRIFIGDKMNGYGTATVARNGIPRNATTLNNLIHEYLDTGLKTALQSYLSNQAVGVVHKMDNGFFHLSEEPVEVYIEKKAFKNEIDDDLIRRIQDASFQISKEKHISESNSSIISQQNRRWFCDSEGRMIKDSSYNGEIVFISELEHRDGFKLEYDKIIPITRNTDTSSLPLEETIEDIIKHSKLLRTASVPISDQYPIILSQSATGTLIHEALAGHLLSAKYISNGISTSFKDKLGKIILPEFITIIDDPQQENSYSEYIFDDEGIRGQKITLVNNGRLETYLFDRESAYDFDTHSNGHARVEWVVGVNENNEIAPLNSEPRVSNIELQSEYEVSEEQLEEIMKQYCVDHHKPFGIYIESGDGEVLPSTGEFMLKPSKAFKIYPSGKREAITNFYIIGGTFELLNQIQVTSNDYKRQHGTCGAESGGVPTQEITPSTFIPNVTLQAIDERQYTKRLL